MVSILTFLVYALPVLLVSVVGLWVLRQYRRNRRGLL